MNIMSGLEIIDLHNKYRDTIRELEEALLRVEDFGYAKAVIQGHLVKVREELRNLEHARFQELEPVTVATSSLGGHDSYIS
jgi:hypothetical protein